MAVLKPKRGEVWWVNFNPAVGNEIQKTRPAVIVSNNHANKILNRFQVIPLTSQIKKVYPSECLVVVKSQVCKAMADQIRTISPVRLGKKIISLSDTDVILVNRILVTQLCLDEF